MVDSAHDKESRARDTINQLKLEIANLTKLVEQGAGLSFGQDTNVQELVKQKEELTKQRDAQLDEIVTVRSKRKNVRLFHNVLICSCVKKSLKQQTHSKKPNMSGSIPKLKYWRFVDAFPHISAISNSPLLL